MSSGSSVALLSPLSWSDAEVLPVWKRNATDNFDLELVNYLTLELQSTSFLLSIIVTSSFCVCLIFPFHSFSQRMSLLGSLSE